MEIFRKIGSWLFLFGVLIALIAGIIVGARWYTDTDAYIAMILGVLGFSLQLDRSLKKEYPHS